MNLLYISSATTAKTIEEISKDYMNGKALRTPQQTFDMSIATGLSKQSNLSLLSIPPVPTYPKSKCLLYRGKKEEVKEGMKINYIPFLNLLGIKQVGITLYVFAKSFVWNRKNKSEKNVIILYSPYYPFMLAAYILKYLAKIKVILIVPDIPSQAMKYNRTKSKFKNKLLKYLNKFKPKIEQTFDGFVLLTKKMNKLINIKNKPFIVMEGLVSKEDISDANLLSRKNDKKVIMYAGAIYEKFGIGKLVEAFHKHVTGECELWIYGNGDFVEKIKEYESIDSRISYK